jgi:formate hydrogenlyase subunit 3/multisubunit Na+/H+ antiporter MnhD subunit
MIDNPSVALFAPIAIPLVAAALLAIRPLRAKVRASAALLPLPALALAVLTTGNLEVQAPWLLLGSRFALDDVGRVFLVFTSVLWAVSAAYAHSDPQPGPDTRTRFYAAFIVSMAGNFGVVLSGDMVVFYLCFATMSFASVPLILHEAAPATEQAGRVYVGFVVLGEVLLFVGFAGLAALGGGTGLAAVQAALGRSALALPLVVCLFAGFGVKTALVPVHMWLPLAYGVAPTAAVAALSGPMIKAGLLGWLRFLPLGTAAFPMLGVVCGVAGAVSAVWGVVGGLLQREAKAALAYSSISQLGLITMGIGAGLSTSSAWPALLPALVLYALHHAVTKSALFLGVGVAVRGTQGVMARRVSGAGLLALALSLAGAPFTGGSLAKEALKKALSSAWTAPIDWFLAAATIGTTLLMARFLVLVLDSRDSQRDGARPMTAWAVWLALLGAILLMPWALPVTGFRAVAAVPTAPAFWGSLWPIALGAVIAWGAWRARLASDVAARWRVPPGDVVWALMRAVARVRRTRLRRAPRYDATWHSATLARLAKWGIRAEERLATWKLLGIALLGTAVLLLYL